MNNEPQTAATLRAQLARQIGYLERSCLLFDQGYEDEAQRLATTLRVLLHDTHRSTSLLSLLGQKQRISYVNTGIYPELFEKSMQATLQGSEWTYIGPSIHETGLVDLKLTANGKFVWGPRLQRLHPKEFDLIPRSQSFQDWWTMDLVRGSSNALFSRRKLVLIMANKDGGAHVDPSLEKDYELLKVDDLRTSFDFADESDDVDDPNFKVNPVGGNVAAASVRQIAFEMLETFKDAGF